MRIWNFLALMVLGIVCTLTAQAYRIAFNDTVGMTRTYKTDLTINGNAETLGISAPLTATLTKVTQEKVTAVDNGKAAIATTDKSGNIHVKISGLSGGDDPQTLDEKLPSFSIAYNRTPQGKVSDIKVTGDSPQLLGGPADSALNLTQYPGDGIAFPAGDVAIGDTWTGKDTLDVGSGNTIEVTINYTLKGTKIIDGKTYLVITADIDTTVSKLTMKIASLGDTTMTLSMTIKGTATTFFDEKAGEIFKETYNLASVVNVVGDDQTPVTAKMNLTIKGSMVKAK